MARAWLLAGLLGVLIGAVDVPVATNPILSTITSTVLSETILTIGEETSTSTSECSDGSCAAITLINLPVVSTSTVEALQTIVNTVGSTTIYSSAADKTTQQITPATTSTTALPSIATVVASVSQSIFTTYVSSGIAPPSALVTTVLITQSGTSATSSANTPSSASDKSSTPSGVTSTTKAVVGVVVTVVVLFLLALVAFVVRRRRARNRESRRNESFDNGIPNAFEKDRDARHEIGSGANSAVPFFAPNVGENWKRGQNTYELGAGDESRGVRQQGTDRGKGTENAVYEMPGTAYSTPGNLQQRYELG